MQWLEATLNAVNRCKTPWLVVMIHRPLYVAYPHKSNRVVGEHLRSILEDLFLEYNVDVVFSGHVHSYFRSCQVSQGVCGKGIHYITIGSAGKEISQTDKTEDQPEWLIETQMTHGYGRVHIERQVLRFEFIETESGRGEVIDSVDIHKSKPELC